MGRLLVKSALRPVAVLAATALGLVAPALGQGPFPPVPGPFPVMPMSAPSVAPPSAPGAGAITVPVAPPRPLFQPPADAMRVPYWMQATPGAAPEPAPAGDGAQPAAPVVQFAQPGQIGTGAGQNVQAGGYAAGGYGAVVPGGVWPQPGWGYGTPPGWAPAPYAPQPGWGGGWSQPVMGGRR